MLAADFDGAQRGPLLAFPVPDDLSISEVARVFGLRTSAIRYYEQIGILPAPMRKSGQRRYEKTILFRLAVVQRARESGFTLEEIRELFFGFRSATTDTRSCSGPRNPTAAPRSLATRSAERRIQRHGPGSVAHVAFGAESTDQVHAFHEAAIAAGGTDNGAPGLRPEYSERYYGAFVLDPDGHNVEAVTRV